MLYCYVITINYMASNFYSDYMSERQPMLYLTQLSVLKQTHLHCNKYAY